MVTNGISYVGSAMSRIWKSAPKGRALDDILKMDDKVLDELVRTAQKNKAGIYKSTPWNATARELQEAGTKLAYNDMLKNKLQSLYSKYPAETRTLKMKGVDKKFTVFRGSQGGSNEGYWAQVKDTGELYYVKYGNEAQIRSEQLAGELYELGGVPSTQKTIVSYKIPAKNVYSDETERVGIAAKWMPINGTPDAYDAAIVREGFGLDCWLANWDALKTGNTVMSAGNAARLDVGGSLCFRARGGRKGVAFGENVNELTSFFESFSHSKPYIKDMTREELILSLKRVSDIPETKITELIDKAKCVKYQRSFVNGRIVPRITGVRNPEYLKETLLARKEYIRRFREACCDIPQKEGETIEQYIRRVDGLLEKKTYDIPFEKIQMSTEITDGVKGISMAERLTPSQKKLYEDSYHAFKASAKNKILHNDTGSMLTKDSMLHATSYRNIDEILTKGITTGDARGAVGTGTGCATQTPLCADFWDVQGGTSIKDYFARKAYNPGEANFLPRAGYGGLSNTNGSMVVVVNKKAVDPTIMKNSFKVSEGNSILYQDANMAGHANYITHRAVPIGVPANSIEKIIIKRSSYSPEAIAEMKNLIKSKGLDIKVYDLEGNLL